MGQWWELSWTEEQQEQRLSPPANWGGNDWKRKRDWDQGQRQRKQIKDNFLLLKPLNASFKPPLSIIGFAGSPSCLLRFSPLLCFLFSQVEEYATSLLSLYWCSIPPTTHSIRSHLTKAVSVLHPSQMESNQSLLFFVQPSPCSCLTFLVKEGQGADDYSSLLLYSLFLQIKRTPRCQWGFSTSEHLLSSLPSPPTVFLRG